MTALIEEFEIGTTVLTPYGQGEVEEVRADAEQLVLRLASGGKAYLQASQATKKKKLFEMTNDEKRAQAKTRREEGNMFFKLGDYGLAVERYEIAKVYLRQLDVPDKPEMLSLLNNIALACIKAGRIADAVQACDDAIANNFSGDGKLGAGEVKCLYLRGQASRKRGDLESALADLMKAVKAAPQNKPIRDEYDAVVKELKAAKEKEASIFKKAFETQAKTQEPAKQPANQDKTKPDEDIKIEKKPQEASPSSENSLTNKENKASEPNKSFMEEYGTSLAIGLGAALVVLFAMSRG